MANDLNVCTFTGRLGADPEVRSAGSNRVANLRLAVGESWKKDGEKKEKTEWIPVTVWGDGLVGIVESYLKKGSKILVAGKFQTRKWQDKDGNDLYTSEIVLQGFDSKLLMLDGKADSGSSRQPDRATTRASSPSIGGYGDDLDSEVPF